MKKKIISILAAAAIAASCLPTALAFTYNANYDIIRVDENYNSENNILGIGESGGLVHADSAEESVIVDLGKGTTYMSSEFYMTYDFMLTEETARIRFSNSNNKTGPFFDYSGGQLRTQTGSSSFQNLGEFETDKWYTAEFEGKMVVSGAKVTLNLYSNDNGTKTLVKTTDSLNLRNFYAGSKNGNMENIKATGGVIIDNLYIVSKYADSIHITAESDELDAGKSLTFGYNAQRQGEIVTSPAVTWSVYNEAGTQQITDGSVTISQSGVLVADIHSPTQVVNVRATAENGLYGTYALTINEVSSVNELFDSIVISGPESVSAGSSASYSFTASKLGEDVTADITDEDVMWTVYDPTDLRMLGNKYITVENGVLTVGEGVVAQDIILRASTVSGVVYGSYPIKIAKSEAENETLLGAEACETEISNAELQESWDGSMAYYPSSEVEICAIASTGAFVRVEADVKFVSDKSGFTLKSLKNNYNPCIRRNGTKLAMQTASNKYTNLVDISADKWYHFEVVYSESEQYGAMNVWEYDDEYNLGAKQSFLNIAIRNGDPFGCIGVEAGTLIDNIEIYTPIPDTIDVYSETAYMFAGETKQFTADVIRNDLPIGHNGIEWEVYDADNMYPLGNENITIDDSGLLSVGALVSAQTVYVRATSTVDKTVFGIKEIDIQASTIFQILNIGVNESNTKIVELYVNKNYAYDDSVTFVATVYDAEGRISAVAMRGGYGDSYGLGENTIPVDLTLPENFNPETDTIKVFAWTSLN